MKEVRCVFMFAVLALWMALPVGAQNAKRGITMSLVNESLASALRKVQQESDYKVNFVIEDVKSYTTTVHLKNTSASTAVKQILQGKPFTYSVSGKFITVKKVLQHKTAAEATDNGAAIRPLSGTITDEDGEPMIGASVVVPGSPFGTVTNTDGNFEFYIPKGCHEVTVSYVGMNDQKVKVAGRDHVKIVMSENKTILGEVVVTGYQTISKERATGAFAKVTADELKDKRLGNLSTVLAGEVAGYNDGMIRGVTTMNASASPLYVIDGFPVEKTKLTGNGTGDITEEIPVLLLLPSMVLVLPMVSLSSLPRNRQLRVRPMSLSMLLLPGILILIIQIISPILLLLLTWRRSGLRRIRILQAMELRYTLRICWVRKFIRARVSAIS